MINLIKRVIKHIVVKSQMGEWGGHNWKCRFKSFGVGSEIGYPSIMPDASHISIGKNCLILSNSRIQNYPCGENNPEIVIGDHCIIGYHFTILNASKVELGKDVLIASHVIITSENHSIDPECELPYMNQPLQSKPVTIGDGCWIGEKVCILPGVSIGKKCIIGAGSIVTKSIPDYCIAVGNPAKVIKKYNFETHNWESVS